MLTQMCNAANVLFPPEAVVKNKVCPDADLAKDQ
jgi:hypothetical protein